MAIFLVQTTEPRRPERGAGFKTYPLECRHDTLEALLDALKDGPVQGEQLIYDWKGDDRPRVIKGRRKICIREGAYTRIELAEISFVEAIA